MSRTASNTPPGGLETSRHGLLRNVLRNPTAVFGFAGLVIVVVAAVFAPLVAPYPHEQQVGEPFEGPSSSHWLGLDDGGVDVLSLVIWGARVSLAIGALGALLAVTIGTLVGLLAGYFGGKTDTALMRLTDYFLVIPEVPLMIVIAALWGPSMGNLIIVIGCLLWTSTARIVRSQVKSVRAHAHVKRARTLGASNTRIVRKHVFPYIAPLAMTQATLMVAVAIFAETALSFLGLGDPSRTSWGKLLRNAFSRNAITQEAWWALVAPGACITLTILCIVLLSQSVEEAMNPRLGTSNLASKGFRVLPGNPRGDQ